MFGGAKIYAESVIAEEQQTGQRARKRQPE
jgi:hypothetical protein